MDSTIEPLSAPPLNHQSLPESVYQWLRSAIFSGQFQPGQMLRQEEIARQLGVSRVPLREALQRLEGEGQVVLHPRRGYAVMELNLDEISEIFRMRMLIEERAALFSARNRTESDVRGVAALFREMEEIPLRDAGEIAQWSRINIGFHEALLAAARLPYIQRLAGSLRAVVEPYIRMEVSFTGGLDQAHAEHRAMVDAFADGDAKLLARLSREHCEHTAERLLKGLKERMNRTQSGQVSAPRDAARG
jgi:DNA-binding GntR family transcriptional regulator